MSEEMYKVDTICSNCDYSGETEIPKGTKVEEMVCPQCGCNELSRPQNFI